MKTNQKIFRNNAWVSIGEQPSLKNPLVFIFGNRFLLETKDIHNEVKQLYPDGHLIFGTSSGEIVDSEVSEESISITAIEFEKTTFQIKTHNIKESNYNSRDAGKSLVSQFNLEGLKHIFVVSEGSNVNGSQLTNGMRKALQTDILITGCLCGDDGRFEKTMASYNESPKEGEIIAIGFYGETFESSFSIYGGWNPFGPKRVVTKSKDNILYELDGKPALALYKKYLGEKQNELPKSALIYPLNVTSKKNKQAYVRTILNIDEENEAMVLAGDIPEDSKVQLMMASMDDLVRASEKAAINALEKRSKKPQLALLVSCIGRKLVLNQRVEEEVEEVREVLGENVTLTGLYSYGEIAPFRGERSCKLHNQTMTITLISE